MEGDGAIGICDVVGICCLGWAGLSLGFGGFFGLEVSSLGFKAFGFKV